MESQIDVLKKIHDVEMFRYCEQCGRCSSACPITGVNGFNIRRLIRHVELDMIDEIVRSPMPWFCATCGRCEDACPNGIRILDITRTLRALTPDDRMPDVDPPCVRACPAGIDIPGYLRLIAQKRPEDACALIMEKAPFPGILGRVCPHPCESACKRGEVNYPVAICSAKRFAADAADCIPEHIFKIDPDTGRRVAIIGSGPAGLTAAFYLRRKGHSVTIFEARLKIGGMLRYGIPAYRLPDDVLDKEIHRLLDMGIELKTDTRFGTDVDVELLRDDGYDSIFIAVGAQLSKRLPLDGIGLDGVMWGVDFLTRIRDNAAPELKKEVVVIGGGNVAIDVALSALRLGAGRVTVACLECREEMPANPDEIETAVEEGIELLYRWGPGKIIGDNSVVSGLELVRCLSVFDDDGNFCPCFEDDRINLRAEQVILAVGQTSETEFCRDFCFLDDQGTLTMENGLIAVNPKTQETTMPGVFAGGDVTTGPGTVIEAVGAGRRAAESMDKYLGGNGIVTREIQKDSVKSGYTGARERGFADILRAKSERLNLDERHTGFHELETGMSEAMALREVNRCLQCDLEICLVS